MSDLNKILAHYLEGETLMEVSSEEWVSTVTSYRHVYNTWYLYEPGMDFLISRAYEPEKEGHLPTGKAVGFVMYHNGEKRYFIPANLPSFK